MLKIDGRNQSFSLLDTPAIVDVSIKEPYDVRTPRGATDS